MPNIQTVQETTVEKLKTPVSVAGRTAELAEVTRFFSEDMDTGERVQDGTPSISILWGVSAEDKVAAIEVEQAEIQTATAEKLAALEQQKTDIAKADVAVVEEAALDIVVK
jgi:hypothetical protein